MSAAPIVIELTDQEKDTFDTFVKESRGTIIRSSQVIVDEIFSLKGDLSRRVGFGKDISQLIKDLREEVWQEFLKDEVEFNAAIMKELHNILETPNHIVEHLIRKNINELKGEELMSTVKSICGEYAGRVFPYLYRLSLSNTQSRRSRSGKTFEAIIYKLYELLEYDFDSQGKVGRRIFDEVGLGKKVDSILPSIACFKKRRNKTIIGTMKTSLRERWQEVAEEIERTKIPEIHLLTADESISKNKADEMSNHNIIVVAYDWVANSNDLKARKNIISFEEYFFEEIPTINRFWVND